MRGAIPPLPQYAFMAWCLVKHGDNFTFTFTFTIYRPARETSQPPPNSGFNSQTSIQPHDNCQLGSSPTSSKSSNANMSRFSTEISPVMVCFPFPAMRLERLNAGMVQSSKGRCLALGAGLRAYLAFCSVGSKPQILSCFLGDKPASTWNLATRLHYVPRLKLEGALPPLPLFTFMAPCFVTQTTLTL
jgi:hypothetical protein